MDDVPESSTFALTMLGVASVIARSGNVCWESVMGSLRAVASLAIVLFCAPVYAAPVVVVNGSGILTGATGELR